MNRFSESQ